MGFNSAVLPPIGELLNHQMAKGFFRSPPTDKEINQYLDSEDCPLSKVVVSDRNKPAMEGLRTYAFTALLRQDHSCKGMNFGFYCGPGQGKSFTIKCWAETMGIPFVTIQSDALESTWQLFEMIAECHKKFDIPLVPTVDEYTYWVPPCIVFFDEAQALSKDLRTGGLLNAMESSDSWLQTCPPGKGQRPYFVDCQHICWVAASTDPGEIYAQSEAFHSRFAQHVVWYPAGASEVAMIVQRNYPDLPYSACETVASYVSVPRKAIAFANLMQMRQRMKGYSWEKAAAEVATINSIDQFGMEAKQIQVLRALGQGAVSRSNLPTLAGCRKAELESVILPPLFDSAEGRGQLLRPTHKGYAITRRGLQELDKRGITHKGDKVTAEMIEGLL